MFRKPRIGLPGLGRGKIIWDAVGVWPGLDVIPAPVIGTNGIYSWCPTPTGHGPPQDSILPYFPLGNGPTAPRVQATSCQSLQALPGGQDGIPDPPTSVSLRNSGYGVYRWSNTNMDRYSHIRSFKNAGMFNVSTYAPPSIRQATNGPPKPPPYPKPQKGREKKFILGKGMARFLSFITETGDVIDCLWAGLPAASKFMAYSAKGGRLGKADKAVAVYDGWHGIDWGKVATCIVANEIEDRVYGNLGRWTGRANRRSGRFAGYEVGPAL